MTAMPGPFFVPGGGPSVPPPHMIPVVQYTPGFSHPVTQQQMIPPAPLPHPPGHLMAPQPLATATQGPVGSQYRTGMNIPPSGFEIARQQPTVQGLTSPVHHQHSVIPGTFSVHNPAAAPSLFPNSSKWSTNIQGSTTFISSSHMAGAPLYSSMYGPSQPIPGQVGGSVSPEYLQAPAVSHPSTSYAQSEQVVYEYVSAEQQSAAVPATNGHNHLDKVKESQECSVEEKDLKPQILEKPETEDERIQRELYRKFGEVIKENGPVEATNEKILNIFIQLTGLERKVIMAQGSIKAFLSKCSYITVSGNTLEVTGDLPRNKDDLPADSLLEDKGTSSNIHSGLDSTAVGSAMPEAWLKEHLRQALFRRFGELLREGPLEVTSQKVLNLFLKLTSADRRFIMNYGGISEFLVTSSFIKIQGNYLVLHGEIPSDTQITSDMAPGLFAAGPANSDSPDTIPAFSSESSLFPSSYLKASSPVFVPKMLENPMTQYLESINELRPRVGSAAATLGSLGVTGYDERAVNGRDQSEALPYSSSASPISSNRDVSAHSSPLTLSRSRGGELYRESGGLRDAATQSIVDVVTTASQTDAEVFPSAASGGIEEKLAKRKLEQALSRAAHAEEKTIDLQAELCKQTLAKIRQEVLDNYIKIVKTPNRSEMEKSALQKDYSTVMRLIQDEIDRVEILHDSNRSALRDGLELKALPEISFTIPTIPRNLATLPQTTFGSGSFQPSSVMMTPQTGLIEKIQDDVMQIPMIGRLRQTSETSSVLSVDSGNIDASKRPPGLDNLQDLKVKIKDSLPNGSVASTADVTSDRPQSQTSSEHSSLATDSKISHSASTPDPLPTPGLTTSIPDPLSTPGVTTSLPGSLPGVLPQMPMFTGFMNAGMTPEAMQHMMLMMQSLGHPPPGQMPPSSAPLPSDIPQSPSVNGETKSGGATNMVDDVKNYFPMAHELEFKAMSQHQQLESSGSSESTRSITRGGTKTMSSDLNSNVYHWPPSSVQDQQPVDQRLSQSSPSTTDRWGAGSNKNNYPTSFRQEEMWEQSDFKAPSVPQTSSWKTSVDMEVSESMSTLAAEPAVQNSMSGAKKPLPVLQSSISTVSVNVVPPKRYTPAEVLRSDVESQGAAASAQLQKAQGQTGQGAKVQKVQGAPDGHVRQKNQDVDATNPLLSSKPSAMPPDGAISGISEINIQDDIGAWETGWEHMLDSDVQWQQVSKKSKKAQEEEAVMSTNFEKLLQKIQDSYPKLTRQDTIQVVNEVRQKRGALKGISIAQILQDAADIIREMKTNVKAVGKPDIAKGIPKDEPEAASNALYKTCICVYWQNGKCTKTSRECIYAHGKKDLRPLPKNNMCNNILSKGSCPYGDKCIFAHSKEELKKAF